MDAKKNRLIETVLLSTFTVCFGGEIRKYNFSSGGIFCRPNFGSINISGSGVIKLFSCLTQLSPKFQRLINTRIPNSKEVSCLKSLRRGIYHANKC